MIRNRKQHSSASVTQSVVAGRRPNEYTVEDVVKLVRISFLAATAKIDMVEDKITPKKIICPSDRFVPYGSFVLTILFASCTTASTKVIVNGISVDMALTACSLQTTVPASTIYSRVKARREKGTYNALILGGETSWSYHRHYKR